MNIESRTCTLVQGEIILNLKINPVSEYVWVRFLPEDGKPYCKPENWGYINPLKSEDVCAAYTVGDMAKMIGKGTKMAEKHWQWLLDCVNSGNSGTIAYNPVALAGFVITAIGNGWATADEINERLKAER